MSPRRRPARDVQPGEPGYRKSLFDQARARRQLKTYEACAEIGISDGHLMRILHENARQPRRPTRDLAERIAKFCGVPAHHLFPDVVPPESPLTPGASHA